MLALIAGRGALPSAVAQAQSDPPLIASLQGNAPDALDVDLSFRIEHLGTFFAQLKDRGVAEVCFCGGVTRPAIDPAQIDALTAPMMPTLAAAAAGGEDSALRAILALFEGAGYAVRSAQDLAPSLLPERGVLTQTALATDLAEEIALAAAVQQEQGAQDLGQACVIRGSAVIAREDARGTDAMLGDLCEPYDAQPIPDPFEALFDMAAGALDAAADWLSGPIAEQRAGAKGGYLFKAPKPTQDARVDLPTIGPVTAMCAAEAGLDGIIIASGGVMVLDQPQVVAILDKMGMFLWVR